MKRAAITIPILFLWLCIAALSLLSKRPICVSYLTSAVAMFTCGSGFILLKIADYLIPISKPINRFCLQEISLFFLTLGYFIYLFILDQKHSLSMLHDISRVILNSATIMLAISSCAEKIMRLKNE